MQFQLDDVVEQTLFQKKMLMISTSIQNLFFQILSPKLDTNKSLNFLKYKVVKREIAN